MAYNFTADKQGAYDLKGIHERLSKSELIEFFPMEVNEDLLTLGISIPLKNCEDSRLESEFLNVMNYLIAEQHFQVTDLYSAKAVRIENLPVLIKEISR